VPLVNENSVITQFRGEHKSLVEIGSCMGREVLGGNGRAERYGFAPASGIPRLTSLAETTANNETQTDKYERYWFFSCT
jgi:hypothetical protein